MGAGLLFAGPAAAQTILLNEQRIELPRLVAKVGEATGRTILHDESVRGLLSIVAKRPVTLDEAWRMLDSALTMMGFSLLPSTEGMWRIAKVAEAIGESPFVERIDAEGESEGYVTTLIPLRVADPNQVLSVLQPLAGSRVAMVPFEETRSLIASGPERSIARLTTIADALDRVEEREVRFRVIRYRDVAQVSGWVESLFDAGQLSPDAIEIWSDERTNSLIYRGSEAESARLRELIDRMDQPIVAGGEVQVLKVLNRDVAEVGELIQQLGSEQGDSSSRLASSDFTVSVDEPSRSLIVRADPDTQGVIRDMVEELDQAPDLIAVDVKLSEIRTPTFFTQNYAFSVPLSTGNESGEVISRLISIPDGGGLASGVTDETTFFGRVDETGTVPFFIDEETGVSIPITESGVIEAGDLYAMTEILFEPSLVLTAGDRHEIFVGNNLPVPVSATPEGFSSDEGAVANPLTIQTNFERRDIGINLQLEANTGEEGIIDLEIDLELSELTESVAGDPEEVGPTFIEDKFISNARLRDGEVAIIGRYLERDTRDVVRGTPWLSSLPFLGWAFTRIDRFDQDVHLVLVAQVRRIESPAELAADTIRRRLAFERRRAQTRSIPSVAPGEAPYAVLVTTRKRRDDAEAIAESLIGRGFEASIHRWELGDGERFDVYVTRLGSMAEAASIAWTLYDDGWQTDVTLLPTRSRS